MRNRVKKSRSFLSRAVHFLFRIISPVTHWLSENFGPIRILVVMSSNFGFGYQLPLIQAMEKCPEIYFRITLDPIKSAIELRKPVEQAYFNRYFIPLKTARLRKWHYRIGTSKLSSSFFQEIIGIQLNHGTAIGNSRHGIDLAADRSANIHFFPSRNWQEVVLRHAPETREAKERIFFCTGAAKLDPLFQNQFSREKSLTDLGLSANRKTILIGSHWSPRSILRTWRTGLLTRLAEAMPDCNIIQTAHEHLWQNPWGDVMPFPEENIPNLDSKKLLEELEEAEKKFPNFRLVRTSNSLDLMNASDLFIGDYSSSLVEFSVLDRPILFFDNPKIRFFDEEVYHLYVGASTPFTNLEGIEDKVRAALKNPATGREGRQILADYFVDYRGTSAKRCTDLILALGRIGSLRSPRWKRAAELSLREWQTGGEALPHGSIRNQS